MKQLLHIFRAGTHTSSNGVSMEFTDAMLQACVDAYDPLLHEAPIVVGHPKDDDPAYGWIKSLVFSENNLEAEPCDVDPQFAELVESKRYKKISASFYLPDGKSNPKPGVLYLRHVGFLGAQPPAIKGLKAASFSSHDEGVIEFSDWGDMQVASLFRRMREFLIEKFSRDDADKVIPDYAVSSLEELARNEQPKEVQPIYSEESGSMNEKELKAAQEKLAADQAALAQAQADFAERESKISKQERATQRVELALFAEGLIKEGKLLAVHKDGMVEFMVSLSAADVIEFGEGDAKKKVGSVEFIKDFLSKLPRQVDFTERAPLEKALGTAEFSAPPGFIVDAEAAELHAKAKAHQAANPSLSFTEAVKAVAA